MPNEHTGKELELTLAGTKPLVMFYDDADAPPSQKIIPEKQFDKLLSAKSSAKPSEPSSWRTILASVAIAGCDTSSTV